MNPARDSRRLHVGLALAVALLAQTAHAAPQALTLRASDGLTVHAQHATVPSPKGVVLLFHQADSNLHEYGPVVTRLARAGYASLAVDARVGGTMFGAENQTARAAPPANYAGALPDLEAAVLWAQKRYPGGRIFALGSSYSAMLLFPLAERHPGLAGILAFSPADYTDDGLVLRAASNVRVPVFATSRGDAEETQGMDRVLGALKHVKPTRFLPSGTGLHGASSLREDRNILGTAPQYWAAMLKFLARP